MGVIVGEYVGEVEGTVGEFVGLELGVLSCYQ